MGRGATALAGVLVGVVAGLLLLVLTEPTSAYTNDSYRRGASVGFVLRYASLGLVAALLARALRHGRRPVLAGIGLAVVLTLAIIPPVLDTKSESEKRRAEAVAADDPAGRRAADFRAGAIDGCVDQAEQELQGTPEADDLDADVYCTCFVDAILEGPDRDSAQLQAATAALRSGKPPAELQRKHERCRTRAVRD